MSAAPDEYDVSAGVRPACQWALAIGWISILLGGTGFVSAALRVWEMFAFLDLAHDPNQQMAFNIALLVGQGTLSAIAGLLLLVAGMALVRMSPFGRTLHLAVAFYMAVFMLLVVSGIVLAQLGGNLWGLQYVRGRYGVGYLTALIPALAYPAFLLWWFFRRRIREEVATWSGPGRAASE